MAINLIITNYTRQMVRTDGLQMPVRTLLKDNTDDNNNHNK